MIRKSTVDDKEIIQKLITYARKTPRFSHGECQRHNGYMQELFTEMLNNVHENVYCSCWRLLNNNRVVLHTLMSLFGFEEVIRSRVHWKVPHNCFRDYEGGCPYSTGINCECYEDLYLRPQSFCLSHEK